MQIRQRERERERERERAFLDVGTSEGDLKSFHFNPLESHR